METLQIKDKKTGNIIASGLVKRYKNIPLTLVSLDNVTFFKREGSISYDCFISPYDKDKEIAYILPKIKDIPYKKAMYNKLNSNMDAEVYIEHNYIDKRIRNLVYSLSSILGIKTIGSCDGHYKMCPWVSFECKDIRGLSLILRTIEPYSDKVIISSKLYLGDNKKTNILNTYKNKCSLVMRFSKPMEKDCDNIMDIIANKILLAIAEEDLYEKYTKDKYGFPEKPWR